MADCPCDDDVTALRRFNRFYTRRIGVLQEGLLGRPFSLAEGRVLFELGSRGGAAASDLVRDLDLDPGYVSRILRGFSRRGFVCRRTDPTDRRRQVITLTEAGRRAFEDIDARSREDIGRMLGALPAGGAEAVVRAAGTIERLLAGPAAAAAPSPFDEVDIRTHLPGDLGWIVGRHGAVYATEHGFDHRFEGLVAKVIADFVAQFDPARDRAFIAARGAVRLGSAMVVDAGQGTAKLRLVLVEPAARGTGLGRRLVDEAIAFARAAGYVRIVLWTNDVLLAARRLYETAGFVMTASEPHAMFGPEMIGETWELALSQP